jgi:hypothetical protein
MQRILFLPDIRLIKKPDTGYPAGYLVDIRYLALPDIRPDIRQFNLVSGRIPDIKKGRIIRPDIRCIPNNFE